MQNWNKVWAPKVSMRSTIIVKYFLPSIGILAWFFIIYRILTEIGRLGVIKSIIAFLIYTAAILFILFFSLSGVNPSIEIYKEGIWVKSPGLISVFSFKFNLFGKEIWIEWRDIEKIGTDSEFSLPVKFPAELVKGIKLIFIFTKGKKYPVTIDLKDIERLKQALIEVNQENKLVVTSNF